METQPQPQQTEHSAKKETSLQPQLSHFDSQISLANMFDYSTKSKFKNKHYILKFSNQSNVKFFKDELTIKYSGKGYNLIDYATVQANHPINNKDPIFYFEIEVLDEGSKRDITVGFSDKEVVLNKQCGTISKSYGYNGDGKVYGGETKEAFGQSSRRAMWSVAAFTSRRTPSSTLTTASSSSTPSPTPNQPRTTPLCHCTV